MSVVVVAVVQGVFQLAIAALEKRFSESARHPGKMIRPVFRIKVEMAGYFPNRQQE